MVHPRCLTKYLQQTTIRNFLAIFRKLIRHDISCESSADDSHEISNLNFPMSQNMSSAADMIGS